LNELAAEGKSFQLPRQDGISVLFHQIDRAVKMWQRRGMRELLFTSINGKESQPGQDVSQIRFAANQAIAPDAGSAREVAFDRERRFQND
jgi:hypothetical protein